MPYQIAFAWSKKTEAELKELGFEKREVYVKSFYSAGNSNSDEMCKAGDSKFFQMRNPPFQFGTFSFWGAGND